MIWYMYLQCIWGHCLIQFINSENGKTLELILVLKVGSFDFTNAGSTYKHIFLKIKFYVPFKIISFRMRRANQ